MEFAHIELPGKMLNGKLIGEVSVDVLQERQDFFVVDSCMAFFDFVVEQGTVQQDHEFDEEDLGIKSVGKACLSGDSLQFFHVIEQVMAFPRSYVHYTGLLPCQVKTAAQIFLTACIVCQKIWSDVDDDALIGQLRCRHRPMDFSGTYEENIARGQRIGFPFNDIVSLAVKKKDDFVKIMVVERNGLQRCIV